MDLSIIGYSERVKKYYLQNKNLKINKILRRKVICNSLFTTKLNDLLKSKYILISLERKKTFQYILKLKRMKYKGSIIIETPSISIYRYFFSFINKNIIVLEDLIFSNFILKLKKIIRQQKIEKVIIINSGYYIFYHFISIIYFWNNLKLPSVYKKKNENIYLRNNFFFIKTNLVKKKESNLKIKLVNSTKKITFFFDNNLIINNTELYLIYIAMSKK